MFKASDASGAVVARYGLFDLGFGAVDEVNLENVSEAGVASFVYFYDVTNRKSVNIAIHSSLNGKTPQDRYFSEPNLFHRLSDEAIEHSFLLEIERKVSADNVITIDQVEYEVDCRFSKQHIKLRYSPGLDEIYIVEADGTLTPIRLLNKVENAFVKRDKVHICRGED